MRKVEIWVGDLQCWNKNALNNLTVEACPTEKGIARLGHNLKHAVTKPQQGRTEPATAKIVDEDCFVPSVIRQAGRQCSRHRILNKQAMRKPCQGCRLLGRFALGQARGWWHGNHRVSDFSPDELLRIGSERLEKHCREFLRLHANRSARKFVFERRTEVADEVQLDIGEIYI